MRYTFEAVVAHLATHGFLLAGRTEISLVFDKHGDLFQLPLPDRDGTFSAPLIDDVLAHRWIPAIR